MMIWGCPVCGKTLKNQFGHCLHDDIDEYGVQMTIRKAMELTAEQLELAMYEAERLQQQAREYLILSHEDAHGVIQNR